MGDRQMATAKTIKGKFPCFMCRRWFNRAVAREEGEKIERGEIGTLRDACTEYMNEEHRMECERWLR